MGSRQVLYFLYLRGRLYVTIVAAARGFERPFVYVFQGAADAIMESDAPWGNILFIQRCRELH